MEGEASLLRLLQVALELRLLRLNALEELKLLGERGERLLQLRLLEAVWGGGRCRRGEQLLAELVVAAVLLFFWPALGPHPLLRLGRLVVAALGRGLMLGTLVRLG